MSFSLHLGDCLVTLKTLPSNSVDSVVCDPPYGLAFMGKRWDYDVPSVEIWAECLRVLKPGGHLLAFAGTRTQHRMAVRIEDAGFEIRDMIAWVYGSGFPKSLDVSKAIDKAGGDPLAWRAFSEAYAEAVKASELTHSDIDRALGIKSSSCYWARADHRGGMPPRHHWEQVRELLALPEEFARLYDEAEREVVGVRTMTDTTKARAGFSGSTHSPNYGGEKRDVEITIPATESARQWQGWGTALKPALEPITVARKPLTGTVAENVLAHGTGALNIDGCRVGDTVETWPASRSYQRAETGGRGQREYQETGKAPPGRWPANLIHDGSDDVVTLAGEQARFFYCAKASKADRGAENNHPTVKPTDLMRYLCRLVTPPGGVVLDPFMGSGSTGKAAVQEGFRFIGCELSPEYLAIANARIAHVLYGDLA